MADDDGRKPIVVSMEGVVEALSIDDGRAAGVTALNPNSAWLAHATAART
jgi:hypothetical protein